MANSETVHTSTRLWSQEVALAQAQDQDSPLDAILDKRRPVQYRFSNGREFRAPADPYAPNVE